MSAKPPATRRTKRLRYGTVSRASAMSNEGVHGPYQRVLMLGLDGLSAAFLRSPLVESTMPNLLGLLRDSSVGSLRSTVPPYTAPGWTSITTGMHPDRHGVFSFTD